MVLARLILTSNGLTSAALQEQFRKWIPSDPAQCTVWYIPTAPLRDGWSRAQVAGQVATLQRTFGLGKVESIDVEYVKGAALREAVGKLGKVDVIYAEMGNTYNLAHHLGESGGDELVRELVAGGALYVGASAGAIMAGRTVQMALWKNWDDQTCEGTVSKDWNDKEVARGLDLAGGRSIFPHANGQYASKDWQRAQAQRHGHTDHEVVPLKDGTGLVIEGGSMRVV